MPWAIRKRQMFKSIFSHLKLNVNQKPSIAAKYNRWALATADFNINRFENTFLAYKKELLSSKQKIKKPLAYNNILSIETLSFNIIAFISLILLLLLSFICLL